MDTQWHPSPLACHASRKSVFIQISFFITRLEQSLLLHWQRHLRLCDTSMLCRWRIYKGRKQERNTSLAGWLLINGGHLMLETYKRAWWSTRTCQTFLSERNLVQRYIVGWLSILLRASAQNHSSVRVTEGIDKGFCRPSSRYMMLSTALAGWQRWPYSRQMPVS